MTQSEPITQPKQSYGRAAILGSIWVVLGAVVNKSGSIIAQYALGLLLAPDDFGIYAIAISVTEMVRIIQNGGISHVLIQITRDAYERLVGSAFWMSMALNICGASILAIGASPIAEAFGDERLKPMLYVLALSFILQTPNAILSSGLSRELRFGALSTVRTCSSVIRNVSMIVFAAMGFGAMSFVYPILVWTVLELIGLLIISHKYRFSWKNNFSHWRELFQSSKWIILGSAAAALLSRSDNIILGAITTTEILGVYFFAVQLVSQTAILLGYQIQTVLFPSFTRIVHDGARVQRAILRSGKILALTSAIATLGFAALIRPVESLFFGGKWSAAVVPIQLLGFSYLPRILLFHLDSLLLAKGQFKTRAAITSLLGVVMAASVVIGMQIWQSAAGAAAGGAFTMIFVMYPFVVLAFRHQGVSARKYVAATCLPWLGVMACALVGYVIGELTLDSLGALRSTLLSSVAMGACLVLYIRFFFVPELILLSGLLPQWISGRVLRLIRVRPPEKNLHEENA